MIRFSVEPSTVSGMFVVWEHHEDSRGAYSIVRDRAPSHSEAEDIASRLYHDAFAAEAPAAELLANTPQATDVLEDLVYIGAAAAMRGDEAEAEHAMCALKALRRLYESAPVRVHELSRELRRKLAENGEAAE